MYMQRSGLHSFVVRSGKSALLIVLLAACGLLPHPGFAQESAPSTPPNETPSARALVHILDYMGQDYSAAVADGKVINELEYAEMAEFSTSATELLHDLMQAGVVPQDTALTAQVAKLQAHVQQKAGPEEVALLAATIRNQVIARSGLQMAPRQWPDLGKGQQLYAQLCVACHGAQGAGDGPLAAELDPAPTNFVDGDRIASISPFQAYNTIHMGVEGTSMQAYSQLSEQEVWDLAFFVKSLQAASRKDGAAGASDTGIAELKQAVSLEQVAALNDADLAVALEKAGVAHPALAVAALRMSGPDDIAGGTLDRATELLDGALAAYEAGRFDEARRNALLAYLEGVEPAEPSLNATDATLTAVLEQRMFAVRSAIEGRKSVEDVARAVDVAIVSIDEARDALQQRDRSAWFAFFIAASILLREGLEAFLIILAVLGVIRAVGNRQAALWVHGGWIAALLVGVAAWIFSDLLIRLGAAQREFMEGGIALVAVAVLLYVGFWLHSKTEIKKWREFIDVRVKTVLQGGNLMGLAAISFFAVFREAFESVLFLSALTLEQGPESKTAITLGALLSIVAVFILAAVALRASARLPVRSLFKYSSFIMGVLSVILVGKGLHSLQEAGLLSITVIPYSIRATLLGVYPTVETLLAQAAVILAVVLLWTLPTRLAARPAARATG